VKAKFVVGLIEKGGNHFVSVQTPLGKPDVQYPTTFEPDYEHEVGPFDTKEEAQSQLKKTEDELRKRGELWIPRTEFKAKKKAKAKTQTKTKQRGLF
jgi:hypothetical protein